MTHGSINLFIVSDNALVVYGLKHYLESRFGHRFSIRSFCDVRECIRNVNSNTNAVICDYSFEGKSSENAIKMIRAINPTVQVVMHTDASEVARKLGIIFPATMEEQTLPAYYGQSAQLIKWN